MNTVNMNGIILAMVAFAGMATSTQAESLTHIIEKGKSDNQQERRAALVALRMARPNTEAEVRSLLAVVHGKDEAAMEAAAKALENVSEDAAHLKAVYVSLLDNDSERVQLAAINGCSRLKASESAPKVRVMLKSHRPLVLTVKGMTPDDMRFAGTAAEALATFKYYPALDDILSRDEIMGMAHFGGPLVARFGAKALPKAVELARQNNKRRQGGLVAISHMVDVAAISDLTDLVSDNDPEIASAATAALSKMRGVHDQDREVIIKALMRAAKSSNRSARGNAYAGLLNVDPQGTLPILQDVLRKDALARLDILNSIMANRIVAAVPLLETFIRQNEKDEPTDSDHRAVAAQAIYKLTGKRVVYKGLERQQRLYKDPYERKD